MKLDFGTYNISPTQNDNDLNLNSFIKSNKDRLARYFPKTLDQNKTLEASRLFVNKKVHEFGENEEFLFTLKKKKTTNELIGLIFLKELDWERKKGEFAYCIDKSVEIQGIMSQAIKKLSQFTFDEFNLETLQIIVHHPNFASIKVAKNCSFSWVNKLEKDHIPPDEEALDMELYELN